MPNYNTEFSEQLDKLAEEERAWLRKILVDPVDLEDKEFEAWAAEFGGEEHAPCANEWPGFGFRFDDQPDGSVSLWVASDDSGNVDDAITLFDMFLAKFRPTEEYIFSWASTCSRPVVGAFGGGSYVCNEQPKTRIAAVEAAIEALQPDELSALRDKLTNQPVLSDREAATVVAGLRLMQQTLNQVEGDPYAIDEIASECGNFDSLNEDEIEDLIERINFGDEGPGKENAQNTSAVVLVFRNTDVDDEMQVSIFDSYADAEMAAIRIVSEEIERVDSMQALRELEATRDFAIDFFDVSAPNAQRINPGDEDSSECMGYIVVNGNSVHFCGGYDLICEDPHTFDSVCDAISYQAGETIRQHAAWDSLDDALATVRVCEVRALPVEQVRDMVQTYIGEAAEEEAELETEE